MYIPSRVQTLRPRARGQILLTKNPDTNKLTVPALLSTKNPTEFVCLCVDYEDIRNELKRIHHAGWTSFHVLSEHHGQHMCTLLKAIEESEAIEILSITNDTAVLMDIKQGGTCVCMALHL